MPFFANKGYHPNITIHPEYQLALQNAHDFIVNLDELHSVLCNEIACAQSCYKEQADQTHISAPEFPIGSKVYVLAEHIHSTCPTKKFAEKYLGPFIVIECVGSLSYQLQLPNYMNCIHPVFHVSQLKPAIKNTIPNRVQSPPPPIEVEGEEEYEIAKILNSKIDRRRCTCLLIYYICWRGYEGTPEEFSWVLATEMHVDELLDDFHKRYPDKPGPLEKVIPSKSTPEEIAEVADPAPKPKKRKRRKRY